VALDANVTQITHDTWSFGLIMERIEASTLSTKRNIIFGDGSSMSFNITKLLEAGQ